MKKAVFIERDGVLNEVKAGPKHQITPLTLDEFKVKKESDPALKKLKAAGFVLIVTTNQPGLSRGYQSRRELDRMHDIVKRCFPLDDLLVCPRNVFINTFTAATRSPFQSCNGRITITEWLSFP